MAYETFYLRASGDGSAPKTVGGAFDAADFNTAGNWTASDAQDDGKIGPGDTVIVLDDDGPIRATLTVQQSGLSGKPITIQGEAAATTIISGSDVITGWTIDGVLTNVWNASVTTESLTVVTDAVIGTKRASTAALAADGEWFWTGSVLSLYSVADPDTRTVEAGQRIRVIDTSNASYITVDTLTLRDSNDNNFNAGSTSVTGVILKNSIVERSAYDGVDLKGSGTAASVTVDGCTIRNNGAWGIWVDNAYTAGTISNNTITGNGWASVRDTAQYAGIQGQLGNLQIYENIIHDNVVGSPATGKEGQSHGIYALASTSVAEIHDNTIYGHPNGNGIKLIGSANVYRNLIYSNGANLGSGIEVGQNGATNVVYVLSYNVIYGNGGTGGFYGIIEGSKGAGTISLSIYNNTVYKNGGTTQVELRVEDAVNILNVKNNVLVATDTRRTAYLETQTGTVAINNNLHWRADGDPAIRYGATYPTWAQWQGYGFDVNGLNVDPSLVSSSDFHLQAGSPCLNAGAPVGLTRDYEDKPVWPVPEIGAYEHVSPGSIRMAIRL